MPKAFPVPRLEQDPDPKALHSLDFARLDPGHGLGEEQVLVPAQGKVVEFENCPKPRIFQLKQIPGCPLPCG